MTFLLLVLANFFILDVKERIANLENELSNLPEPRDKSVELELHMRLIEDYIEIGFFEKAEEKITICKFLARGDSLVNRILKFYESKLAYKRGDRDLSRKILDKAISSKIEHEHLSGVLSNIGAFAVDANFLDLAKKAFKRALDFDLQSGKLNSPAGARSLSNLAGIYLELGEKDGAIDLYKQAIAIDEQFHGKVYPARLDDVFLLAKIYYDKGDAENAIVYLRELSAFKYNPDGYDISEMLRESELAVSNTGEVLLDVNDYDVLSKYVDFAENFVNRVKFEGGKDLILLISE